MSKFINEEDFNSAFDELGESVIEDFCKNNAGKQEKMLVIYILALLVGIQKK